MWYFIECWNLLICYSCDLWLYHKNKSKHEYTMCQIVLILLFFVLIVFYPQTSHADLIWWSIINSSR